MRVHLWLGTLGTLALAVALGLYIWQEPQRLDEARARLLAQRISEGQAVYVENCVVCHGAAGDGLGPNPALARPALQELDYDTLYQIIARGRYGTAMAPWHVDEGGPLQDSAVEGLVLLIQAGVWEGAAALAGETELAPRQPVQVEVPQETLARIAALPGGQLLAPALQQYAAHCVACHGSNGEGSTLAPALNDPQLRARRTAEGLRSTIMYGVPGTLMAGWGQVLDETTIDSLVQFILQWGDLQPGLLPTPQLAPAIASDELVAAGEALYARNCSTCHGSAGQGTPRAPALNVQSFFARVSNDAALRQIITLGVPGTAMLGWGDRLGAGEIEALAAFVRGWEATAPAVAVPERGGAGRGLGPPWLRTP